MTMKRFLLLIGAAFLVAAIAGAQNTGIDSILDSTSYGVFTNELDAAASVQERTTGPGFSELENSYFFGGLSNIDRATARALTTPAFWMGYYMAGDLPWSIFARLDNDAANLDSTDVTVTPGPQVGVVDGNTTTNYTWTEIQTTTNYDTFAFDQANNEAQFLIHVGPVNTGIYGQLIRNNDYDATENYTETLIRYNNTAAAGTPPSTEAEYTRTTNQLDYSAGGGKVTTVTAAVPVFLPMEGMTHFANVSFDLTNRDRSFDQTRTHTTPTTGDISPYTNIITNENLLQGSEFGAGVDYVLTLPGLLGDNDRNEFQVSAFGSFTRRNAEFSVADTTQARAWDGAQWQDSTRVEETTTYAFEAASVLSGGAWTVHSFYFDVGSAIEFGLQPWLFLRYEKDNGNPRLTETVYTDRQDNDNNGVFTDDGVDATVTTTTTYTNTSFDVAAGNVTAETGFTSGVTTTSEITTSVGIPTAVTVQPEGWNFGMTAGARPRLAYTRTAQTAMSSESAQTEVTATVGADPVTETTQADDSTTDTSFTSSWTAQVDHDFGVFLHFGENVRVDATLNGSLLEFNNFQIQTIIALP